MKLQLDRATIARRYATVSGRRREPPLRGLVLVVGPLPPPMMGPAVGTQMIRRAFELGGARVVHVNTQDRRPVVAKVNVLDARNVALALLHGAQMFWCAFRHPVRLVYVPISQGRWGYARDALLIGIARLFGRPVVVHLRGANFQDFFHRSTRLERMIIRRTLKSASCAIALTPALRGVYEGLVAPERVRVLENAVPDPWPDGISRLVVERGLRAAGEPDAPNILFIANDFVQKGYRTMIRALAEPGLEHARLRMVGAPPPEVDRAARLLAEELGVGSRVELTGECLDAAKSEQFEWADVFAYPTENDGQPLVVIEAMAAGLPIVTTRYGGVPDTVGEAAVLVEPRDMESLAAAIQAFVEDPSRREVLGAAARERYLAMYTPERFQERFQELFAELLEEDA
jgi:glycosyltransferase involved in cell wall biosynthesis